MCILAQINYEAAGFWVTLASLVVAVVVSVASLYLSKASVRIAENSLKLSAEVAEREHRDWRQRKWFELYLAAENFATMLERLQTVYDRPLATEEFETDANNLTFAARQLIPYGAVLGKNPATNALFNCIGKWKLTGENLFSKQMLAEYEDAIEGLRQEALVRSPVHSKQ
jgi:hypothetical protein